MPTDTCWTWKTLESHDWWLSSLYAGACASRTPCKSSAIPPSASPPCVLPPFQVLHLLKNPVNYAQKCVRPVTSWNLISSSILHFIVHSIYIHCISFTFCLARCIVWLYSTREYEGGTQTPKQSSSCVSGWRWELGVLEMGLAKEFSASGLAVIIGYL